MFGLLVEAAGILVTTSILNSDYNDFVVLNVWQLTYAINHHN